TATALTGAAGTAHNMTVTETDLAGNVSTASSALAITVDNTAPAQPAAPDLTAGTDLGSSSTDDLTSDNTPDFTGSGTNGNTITLISSVNGTVGTAVVAGGVYTITASALT